MGKVLTFRTASAPVDGLKTIQITSDLVYFRLKQGTREIYFNMDRNGFAETPAYVLYTTPDLPAVEEEDFDTETLRILVAARKVAKASVGERIDSFKKLDPGQKMSMIRTWYLDLVNDLVLVVLRQQLEQGVLSNLEVIRNTVSEIERVHEFITGLDAARECL